MAEGATIGGGGGRLEGGYGSYTRNLSQIGMLNSGLRGNNRGRGRGAWKGVTVVIQAISAR